MIENFTENSMTVRTPSTEWAYVLMTAANGLCGEVQKYYWQSKFDKEIIEEHEPKITDAYDCIVVINGDIKTLNNIIDVYKVKREQRKGLPNLSVALSDVDIARYADKLFAVL